MFGWALLLGGALTSPAHARTEVSETDFFDELPVVLSVSRLSQPVNEAPAAVTVIDQDMIRASGFRDIPDLLRLVPGFSVAYTRDNTWAVGYHGMADAFSRRFQVLVDGRSIYSAAYGAVNWGELPLSIDDIERIEVVRGPNAATYGANAFLAVINIVTKDPSQTPGSFASVQYGEQGMTGVSLRHGGEQGDLRYRMTLSAQTRDRFETDTRDGDTPVKLYEETQTYVVNGRADYRVSDTDEISTQFGLSVGDWQAGHSVNADEPTGQNVSAQYAQFKYRRVHSPDDEWMVHAYFSRNDLEAPNQTGICYDTVKAEFAVCPGGMPSPPQYLATGQALEAGIDWLQTRANLEFQRNQRLLPDWRMVWGAEVRHETVESLRYLDSNETFDGTLVRAHANLEWRARPDLLVQGGAMLEHHYFTGTDISPRLALNYTVAEGHTLRLNLSEAYRSPTFFEQEGNLTYYTTTGDPVAQLFAPSDPLRPERILSREIGYIGLYPAMRLQLDAKLFHDTIHDFINSKGSPGRFNNRDDFTVRGGDLQLNWQPFQALRLSAQYARAFIKADPSIDRDLVQSAPRNTFSLLARYDLGLGWAASAGVYRSGRMKWLSEGDLTQAFTRWDARLARRWIWQGNEVEAAVVGQNLGEDYSEFRKENVFSRRVYGSLSLAW
ncbi:MAG TPA: TonB-dependent receptor [Thiobacillus sp.]|nr:TonB-dependent receptor [Thiobacillus sp.]